jgi:hypothetical protein
VIHIPNQSAMMSSPNVPNPDAIFVDPLSGIVIIVNQGSGSRQRAVKRRRPSPLWRSPLSRWLTAAQAACAEIIPIEPDGRLQSPANSEGVR